MVNANDGSSEGIMHVSKPIFSVQFHPEARGGPYDTQFLFQKFYTAVTEYKAKQKMWENKNFNTKVKPSKVLIIGSGALQIGTN
jgi:GMP synthase-like glutamine amidotransferase